MNLEQKIDTILAAVQGQTTTTASVDANAVAAATVAALQPVLTDIQASLADIRGEVDEPAATTGASS